MKCARDFVKIISNTVVVGQPYPTCAPVRFATDPKRHNIIRSAQTGDDGPNESVKLSVRGDRGKCGTGFEKYAGAGGDVVGRVLVTNICRDENPPDRTARETNNKQSLSQNRSADGRLSYARVPWAHTYLYTHAYTYTYIYEYIVARVYNICPQTSLKFSHTSRLARPSHAKARDAKPL